MSISSIDAGHGVEYLTSAVATDAHDYYTGGGEAPGRWTGGGLARLGLAGEVQAGDVHLLFGVGADPRTGDLLGQPYRVFRTVAERVEARVAAEGAEGDPSRVALIELEEAQKGSRSAVAGYDLTFSPVKSVSALWAIAPDDVRTAIEAAHEAAIDAAFGYLERHALHARTGKDGIGQVDAEGFLVARYRHRTSRNGDPQIHSHCAVANRVWCESDGRWRALDGRGLYRNRAAAGAIYDVALEEQLTARLGLRWDGSHDDRTRRVVGLPAELLRRWSSRRAEIELFYDDARQDNPGSDTREQKRRRMEHAALATRRDKTADGHIGLRERWLAEAAEAGVDWAGLDVLSDGQDAAERQGVAAPARAEVADVAVRSLEGQRAEWGRGYLVAEVVHAAADRGLVLTADDVEELVDGIIASPRVLTLGAVDVGDEGPARRRDGLSIYRHHNSIAYTTADVYAAESMLVDAVERPTSRGTAVDSWRIERHLAASELGVDQAAAVRQILSGDLVSVVVGPAGTGKTRCQRAVVDIAQADGRQVIGLTTSQTAAQVLTDEAGCRAENISMWRRHGGRTQEWRFGRGDVVVVDEAAMMGTLDLAWIVAEARSAGATVALVGDDHQLQAPSAGGIMRRLARTDSAVWLGTVRRFRQPWEADASLRLRDGDIDVAAVYDDAGRLHGGSTTQMRRQIVDDHVADRTAGKRSLVIVDTNDEAAILSGAIRAHRVATGDVATAREVELRDGNRCGVGDEIATRHNDRTLRTEQGRFVANRDTWRVEQVLPDGSLVAGSLSRRGRVTLPAAYVRNHTELAYATTGHGAQGRTVDVGRTLVTARSALAGLYVAMTRGADANHAYVTLDDPNSETHGPQPETYSALTGFAAAIGRDDRQLSAIDRLAIELDAIDSPQRLEALREDAVRQGLDAVPDESRGAVFAAVTVPAAQVDLDERAPAAAGWVRFIRTVDERIRARTDEAGLSAAAEAWAQPLADAGDTQLLASVAYYRQLYRVPEEADMAGTEPLDRRSVQHRRWTALQQRLQQADLNRNGRPDRDEARDVNEDGIADNEQIALARDDRDARDEAQVDEAAERADDEPSGSPAHGRFLALQRRAADRGQAPPVRRPERPEREHDRYDHHRDERDLER
jgi:conjugative relaxase-like TrwC/TraI family protein